MPGQEEDSSSDEEEPFTEEDMQASLALVALMGSMDGTQHEAGEEQDQEEGDQEEGGQEDGDVEGDEEDDARTITRISRLSPSTLATRTTQPRASTSLTRRRRWTWKKICRQVDSNMYI